MTQTPTRRQISGAICKRALLRAIADQETQSRELVYRKSFEDQPTQITGAIRPVQQPRITRPMLPLDELGRPCLEICDEDHRETGELVQEAVIRYYSLAGCYPAVVVMNAFRYLTYGTWVRYYEPVPGTRILFLYEGSSEYSILLRGGIEDAWVR